MISSRMNSARAAKTWKTSRPPGVVVSSLSCRLLNPIPRLRRSTVRVMRSCRERASRWTSLPAPAPREIGLRWQRSELTLDDETGRGVSRRWVSPRPGRMAIVDRTNPWPAVVALAGLLVAGCSAASDGRLHPGPAASAAAVASSPAAPVAQGRPTSPIPTPSGRVSSDRRLVLERTITGAISSKSVVATGTGLVFAQNMMYQHTITVYRADGTLAATIPDSVDLAAYRIAGHPGQVRGAPVEAASSPDHKSMYVSNYSMYGAGFGPEGSDACTL